MQPGDPSVLHFSIAYPPVMDGVAMVVLNYARVMHRLGFSCRVVAPRARGFRRVDEEEGIPGVIRCASIQRPFAKPYVVPVIGPRTRRRLARLDANIVHIHYPILMGRVALRYARKRGLPVVMTFHTRYRDQIRRSIPWRPAADRIVDAVTRFFEQADEVWVPSAEAARVLQDYGFRGSAVRVMGLATDLAVPSADEYSERRTGARRRIASILGVETAGAILLYVGNLIDTKNVDLILDALALLEKDGSSFAAVFAGEGYARERLERKARELGIGHSVVFLGLVPDREEIKNLLAAAELMLFPSVADTAGIVRIEAAAYALPVVVVNEPCAVALIEHGVNGFVAENDAVAYAEAIRCALADRGRLRAVGIRARETLYRGWESRVREAISRYREIIDTARP